ncbi:MAG: cation:proton antiporter [Pseudomonadales bacterium]
MTDSANVLIPLGSVLLASFALEAIGRRTRLPRVSLLILFGFIAGPGGLGWIPVQVEQWYSLVTDIALGMIGFLLGGKLTRSRLHRMGALVAWVSVTQVIVTYVLVGLGLWLLGYPPALALLLAAIGTATDPAATSDVITENNARGNFTSLLQGVVAIDDVWGLIIFSLTLVVVQGMIGQVGDLTILQHGLWELSGAILLGGALGIPAALLTGRLNDNKPVLVETLGIVLLCVGLARWLDVSYLLASVTLGCTVTNLAKHHRRSFDAIEGVEWPFIVMFFVLSGAMLSYPDLLAIGLLGLAYIGLRVLGRIVGGLIAAIPSSTKTIPVGWIGPAMMPQAGVALAMALVAVEVTPQFTAILPLIIASTVVFELIGPILTRLALLKAGDLNRQNE